MGFFKKIGSSMYNPQFYQELKSQPFSFSLKYFVSFSLLLSLLVAAYFTLMVVPRINDLVGKAGPEMINRFPGELKVTLKDGTVSTNVPEPFFVKAPESVEEGEGQEEIPENILTIDTGAQASPENLEKYDTLMLITKDSLVVREEDGKTTIQSLKEAPNFEFDREMLSRIYGMVAPWIKMGAFLIPIPLILVLFPYLIFSKMFYLLFGALFIWVVARIKGATFGYGKSYQLGLHLITLPIILSFIPRAHFFFSFTILTVILAVVNIRKDAESPVAQTSVAPAPPIQPTPSA